MSLIAAVAAGFGCLFVTLALFVQASLPTSVLASSAREVTRAVRTERGDVHWVRYPARDYTSLERVGRQVYVREGCWHCHSQPARPGSHEDRRGGPVPEAGEYSWELPLLLSTRRLGPDLSRVGLKYSDDWHYAHLWNPRLTVPRSTMPRFPWLYTQVAAPVERGSAGPTLGRTEATARYFTFRKDRRLVLFPDSSGLVFLSPRADGEWPVDGTPVLDLTPLAGRPLPLVARLVVPTREVVGLVRYLQKFGASRGVWRDVFEPQNPTVAATGLFDVVGVRLRGEMVYRQHCVGCHGVSGDGNGPAATFLFPRPRDFTAAVFKFRTTPSGSLPTDGDLYRTISRGVRWTAMPPWHELPHRDRLAVVSYIKTFSNRWQDEAPEPTATPGAPPPATPELLSRGRDVYRRAKCRECHGAQGRGDGPAAAQLRDDFDLPSRPTDFTRGQFKGGATVADVFRALTLGLDGTPMPSFADVLPEDDRWAVAYWVLSLSAWVDPLTGERLAWPTASRALAPPVGAAAGLESLTLRELVVAALMGCAALSALLWGAASGALTGGEPCRRRVLDVEGELDERGGH